MRRGMVVEVGYGCHVCSSRPAATATTARWSRLTLLHLTVSRIGEGGYNFFHQEITDTRTLLVHELERVFQAFDRIGTGVQLRRTAVSVTQ